MRTILILVVLMATCQVAEAAQISLLPGGKLQLNVTNPGKNYTDVVLHSILITTGAEEEFNVSGMRIDILAQGQIALSRFIPLERLVGETQGVAQMVEQGMAVFLKVQILSPQGFEGLFGRPLEFAGSPAMEPNQVLMLTRQQFSLDFPADELRVTVHGSDAAGAEDSLSASAQIEMRTSPITYTAPLHGAWLMASLPSIQSHHRLNPPTEFAVDFFKTDSTGNIHAGDRLDATGYFGYGAEVLAVADGEVVFIIADEAQDRAAYFPQAGESTQQARARIGRYNMRRLMADFGRAAAGNIVTIRHEVNGVTEYSSYGHLKAGSVSVALGDEVKRGQVIAAVGDTGDSAAVHLHFQINAGANAFMSKSLPFKFSDLDPVLGGIDPGRFVQKSSP